MFPFYRATYYERRYATAFIARPQHGDGEKKLLMEFVLFAIDCLLRNEHNLHQVNFERHYGLRNL